MKASSKFWLSVPFAAAILSFGMQAPAQAAQSGLVNVSLSNVANNIANNLHVNVSQIPVTVQAPIGIAANVCGVTVNAAILAQLAQAGQATCSALTTSTALNQIVQRQIASQ